MIEGVPNFGELTDPVFNPLVYARRVLITVLESQFSQNTLSMSMGQWAERFRLIKDDSGEITKESKLMIADSFAEELSKTNPRPTIVVSRGTFGFVDLAIDNRRPTLLVKRSANTSPGELMIGDSGRTKMKYADMTVVPISIECYAQRPVETEMLAWFAAGFIKLFAHQIRDGARIHKIGSPNIGPVTKYKQDSKVDLFMAPVVMTIQQAYVWNKHTTATSAEILTSSPEFENESNKNQPQVYGTAARIDTDI